MRDHADERRRAPAQLQPRAFEQARSALAERTLAEARALREQARTEGWHDPVVDTIVETIAARAAQVA